MFDYSVKVFPMKKQGGALKAFASLVIDMNPGTFEIKNFRILESKKGDLFVANPSRQGKDGKYYDDVWWEEDKDEGDFRGRYQEEIFKAFVTAYQKDEGRSSGANRADAAGGNRNDSGGARGDSPFKKRGGGDRW